MSKTIPALAALSLCALTFTGCADDTEADPDAAASAIETEKGTPSGAPIETPKLSDKENLGRYAIAEQRQDLSGDHGALSTEDVDAIMAVFEEVSAQSRTYLVVSADAVRENISQPLLGDGDASMAWITLLGQGASVSSASITSVDGEHFVAQMIDPADGTVLADVGGVYDNGEIVAEDYDLTDEGLDFRQSHQELTHEWATN